MSHYIVYKTSLGNLTPQLLKAAVEFFAKQIGATVFFGRNEDHRYSYGGEDVIVGFKTEDCPYGISFNINAAGELEICGDSYNQHAGYDKYKQMAENGVLTNLYQIMMNAQQQQLNASVNVQDDQVNIAVETN